MSSGPNDRKGRVLDHQLRKVISFRTYRLEVMSFGSSAGRLQLQMIRYWTYRPGMMVSEHQPEVAIVDNKISDLSARDDGFGASAGGCNCR